MKTYTNRAAALVMTFPIILMLIPWLFLRASAANIPEEKSILKIYITTDKEDGSVPLENIIVDIYKTNVDYRANNQSEVKEYSKYRGNLIATLMTDADGYAELDITAAGMQNGTYLLEIQENPAVTGWPKPVVFTTDGTSQSLQLELIPEKSPDIQTDIESIYQKSGSFDIGVPHTWILRSEIPSGICNAREYRISDILDYRLDYEKGSPDVILYGDAGTPVPLDDRHYILTEEKQNRNGVPVDAFQISLTPEGMTHVGANISGSDEKWELRIRFRAAINCSTTMGATIPNDAHLDYVNSAGIVFHADSDIPEVHTGGIHILRIGREGLPLSGSEFMVAREATQAEMEDESLEKEVLHIGNKYLAVLYVDFYGPDLEEGKHFTAVTDADGKAAVCGLACGIYYLVETKTAEGEGSIAQPVEIEISEVSHLTASDQWQDSSGQTVDNTVVIGGSKFIFPETGGMGNLYFTTAGILLLCAASLLLLSNRNKRI